MSRKGPEQFETDDRHPVTGKKGSRTLSPSSPTEDSVFPPKVPSKTPSRDNCPQSDKHKDSIKLPTCTKTIGQGIVLCCSSSLGDTTLYVTVVGWISSESERGKNLYYLPNSRVQFRIPIPTGTRKGSQIELGKTFVLPGKGLVVPTSRTVTRFSFVLYELEVHPTTRGRCT